MRDGESGSEVRRVKIPVEACLFSDTCGVNKVDQGFPLSAGALQPSGVGVGGVV